MKKTICLLFALCAALCLSMMTGCQLGSGSNTSAPAEAASESATENGEIANPFTECDQDMDKACKISGLEFKIPFYSNYTIIAAKGQIQVKVPAGDEDVITVAKMTEKADLGDLSGDTSTMDFYAGHMMTFTGSDDQYTEVTWVDGSGTFSVTTTKPMTLESLVDFATEVVQANSD